ncbi:MAG: NADH-ubiquinone/plastoquinone oxidoreductase chain 6, partial [Gaiellales bacterium]|nr:NADH-ubiquinone/plastoquinone oxidoreductase chain 6 [Gaiellales bacterium]
MTYDVAFVAASALAIISALAVVLSGNPFHSALSLIMNLVSLATMYLLLQADFLAAAQVIVYAG